MMETCRRLHIALNSIFIVPYGIFVGHVVCKQGLMVYPTNIVVIINLKALKNVKQLHGTLGHTRYYRKFIKAYVQVTMLMEKLLNKEATFYWDEECQNILDILKEKLVTMTIFVFLDWKRIFMFMWMLLVLR